MRTHASFSLSDVHEVLVADHRQPLGLGPERFSWLRSRLALAVLLGVLGVCSFAGTGSGAGASVARCQGMAFRVLVILSVRTGAADCAFPSPSLNSNNANISALISDGHGGWFVSCCGVRAVERLRSDGMPYRDWRATPAPRLPGTLGSNVYALALAGNTLYAGGDFGVEALNAQTGARRWLAHVTMNTEQLDVTGVGALAADSHAVYVGGGFVAVDGFPHRFLVALDPRNGFVLPWAPVTLGPAGNLAAINALALDGSRLFIAGSSITTVDGYGRGDIAALDARTGRLLPWRPRPRWRHVKPFVYVTGLFVADGEVFASTGGDENGVDGAASEFTGEPEPWPNLKRPEDWPIGLSAFAAHGDTLYFGGEAPAGFSTIDGEPRNDLAAFNVKTGKLTSWAPQVNRYSYVNRMAISGDRILVAGDFAQSLS